MRKVIATTSMLCIAALSLTGCEDKGDAPKETAASTVPAKATQASAAALSPEVVKEAEEIFAGRCTPCHGPQGKGDGAASAGLTPKPANLADPNWQSSVTDDHIEKIITFGGAAVGKSAAMPPNPDLADKPVVKGLRHYIRSLAK